MNRSVFAILAFALVTPLCHAQVAAPPAPAMTAAPAPATPATTATAASDLWAAPPKPMPKEIHWVRNSAEYRAAVLQAYRGAAKELDSKSAELTSGTWAVVLDADETVIDNSQFQKELAEKGARYSSAAWKAWCLRGEATAIPGAIGFIKHVRDLGGKVVIITNRSVDVQAVTEGNFRKEGIPYDLMLCKSGSSEKEARNDAVKNGTAAAGVPPLNIVMWVGDNIQDFPTRRQDIRTQGDGAFSDFGSRYIVLPNPMYGSWENNPDR